MQSPLSMHELAHRREASGPWPDRRILRTPDTTSSGSAADRPAGSLTGQASKHFPHRVHASRISLTRPASAESKVASVIPVGPFGPYGYSRTRDPARNRHFRATLPGNLMPEPQPPGFQAKSMDRQNPSR